MNEYQQKIEALLFYKNQPVSYTWLSRQLGISVANTKEEVEGLKNSYQDRGIDLALTHDDVCLITNTSQQALVKTLKGESTSKELSKQALETLAIILFKERVTKPEIDFIRGVNSMYILRNLLIRGLVDKKTNPHDRRSPLYVPTLDLLAHLGVTQISDIPEYQSFKNELQKVHQEFLKELAEEERPTQDEVIEE